MFSLLQSIFRIWSVRSQALKDLLGDRVSVRHLVWYLGPDDRCNNGPIWGSQFVGRLAERSGGRHQSTVLASVKSRRWGGGLDYSALLRLAGFTSLWKCLNTGHILPNFLVVSLFWNTELSLLYSSARQHKKGGYMESSQVITISIEHTLAAVYFKFSRTLITGKTKKKLSSIILHH